MFTCQVQQVSEPSACSDLYTLQNEKIGTHKMEGWMVQMNSPFQLLDFVGLPAVNFSTRRGPLTTISGFIPNYTHLQPWLNRVC